MAKKIQARYRMREPIDKMLEKLGKLSDDLEELEKDALDILPEEGSRKDYLLRLTDELMKERGVRDKSPYAKQTTAILTKLDERIGDLMRVFAKPYKDLTRSILETYESTMEMHLQVVGIRLQENPRLLQHVKEGDYKHLKRYFEDVIRESHT